MVSVYPDLMKVPGQLQAAIDAALLPESISVRTHTDSRVLAMTRVELTGPADVVALAKQSLIDSLGRALEQLREADRTRRRVFVEEATARRAAAEEEAARQARIAQAERDAERKATDEARRLERVEAERQAQLERDAREATRIETRREQDTADAMYGIMLMPRVGWVGYVAAAPGAVRHVIGKEGRKIKAIPGHGTLWSSIYDEGTMQFSVRAPTRDRAREGCTQLMLVVSWAEGVLSRHEAQARHLAAGAVPRNIAAGVSHSTVDDAEGEGESVGYGSDLDDSDPQAAAADRPAAADEIGARADDPGRVP